MAQRITIGDLARAAGVSKATIDRILNNRSSVQRQTKEHVLSVAERIGFHAAPALRRRLRETAPERRFGFLLNRRDQALFAELATHLERAALTTPDMRGRARIVHLDDISPAAAAEALTDLGATCDAVACLCVDDPLIHASAARLAARGVAVWTLLSGLSTPHRAGHVGVDLRKAGRTAGWFLRQRLAPGDKIALLIGSAGYPAQMDYALGLQAFLKTHAPQLSVAAFEETQENDERAFQAMSRALRRHPDIAAVAVMGSGLNGALAALRRLGREDLFLICGEISAAARQALLSGGADVAIGVPARAVAHRLFDAMSGARREADPALMVEAPAEILVRENL